MKRNIPFFLFWSFEFNEFEFVSDFEFRHSDLNRKYFRIPLSSGLPEASRSAGGSSISRSQFLCFHKVTDNTPPVLLDHHLVGISCFIPGNFPAPHLFHDKVDVPVFGSVTQFLSQFFSWQRCRTVGRRRFHLPPNR